MARTPSLPPSKRARKHRSKSVELSACLYLLTQAGEEIPFHVLRSSIEVALKFCLELLGVDPTLPWQMQHEPPLALRPFNETIDDYEPGENDYRYMRPMQKEAHAKVTHEVDRPAIDKTRRNAKTQAKHAAAMLPQSEALALAYSHGAVHGYRKGLAIGAGKWPKGRKIQSRGFPKKKR